MAKRKSKEEIGQDLIKKSIEKYGEQYTFEKMEYINSRTPITVTCKDHGDFERKPGMFLLGRTCAKCNAENTMHGTDLESRINAYIRKGKDKYGGQYNYSKIHETFVDRNSEVAVVCKDHGEFKVKMIYHLSNEGTSGCKGCGNNQGTNSYSNRMPLKERLEILKKQYNNKYDYSLIPKSSKANDVVNIICPVHGMFSQSLSSHKASECPSCAKDKQKENARIRSLNKFIVSFDKLDSNYKFVESSFTLLNKKCKFICGKHGEFEHIAKTMLSGGVCPECHKETQRSRNLKDLATFIQESKELYPNFNYDNTKYVNQLTEVEIYCEKHNNTFFITPYMHLTCYSGCSQCDKEVSILNKQSYHSNHIIKKEESKIERAKEFRGRLEEKHGDSFTFKNDDFWDMQTDMQFNCNKHGKFKKQPSRMLRDLGCQVCAEEFRIQNSRITKDYFLSRISEDHKHRFDYTNTEVVDTCTKIDIRCIKHDLVFSQLPYMHIKGKFCCPKCHIEGVSGENAWGYKNGSTTESDRIRRTTEYKQWRRSIAELFPECDCCGEVLSDDNTLFAHHLYSFTEYPSMIYDVNNGVGLCRKCHEGFHNKYKYGMNTKEQYEEYQSNY